VTGSGSSPTRQLLWAGALTVTAFTVAGIVLLDGKSEHEDGRWRNRRGEYCKKPFYD